MDNQGTGTRPPQQSQQLVPVTPRNQHDPLLAPPSYPIYPPPFHVQYPYAYPPPQWGQAQINPLMFSFPSHNPPMSYTPLSHLPPSSAIPQLSQIDAGSSHSELAHDQPRLERGQSSEQLQAEKFQFLTSPRSAPYLAEVLWKKTIGIQDPEEQLQTLTVAIEVLEDSLKKRNNPEELDTVALAFKPLMSSMLSTVFLNPNIQDEGKRRLHAMLGRLESVFDAETVKELRAVLTRLDAPERTAPVCYKYGLQTKQGFMRIGSSLVPILVIENCKPSVYNCFQVTHVNQIHYKFWDQNTNSLICEKPDMTLGQYLGDSPVIGMVRNRFNYLVPMVRKVLREILAYIVDMHKRGFMLDRFTEGDLHLIDGTIKFVGVGLNRHDGNRRQLAVNFHNLAYLVEGLVHGQSRPPDLTDFIARIKANYISEPQALGLLHHICLMPPSNVLRFFINLGSELIETPMKYILNRELRKLGICTNWQSKLDEDGYLMHRIFLRGLDKNAENRTKVVYHNKARGGITDDHVRISMLKFCRNLAVHLRAFSSRKEEDTTLNLQVLILHPFAEKLCLMQKNLCDSENPHKWFE